MKICILVCALISYSAVCAHSGSNGRAFEQLGCWVEPAAASVPPVTPWRAGSGVQTTVQKEPTPPPITPVSISRDQLFDQPRTKRLALYDTSFAAGSEAANILAAEGLVTEYWTMDPCGPACDISFLLVYPQEGSVPEAVNIISAHTFVRIIYLSTIDYDAVMAGTKLLTSKS